MWGVDAPEAELGDEPGKYRIRHVVVDGDVMQQYHTN